MAITTKFCKECSQEKSIKEFYHKVRSRTLYPDSLAGWSNRCKECDKQARREYVKLFPDDCKRSDRAYHLSKYNLTPGDYNEIFFAQEGKCKGCKRHQSEFKRRLVVDHNHATGEVRGLLCISCNLCLGYVKDDPSVLIKLSQYLINSNSELADSKSNVVCITAAKKAG